MIIFKYYSSYTVSEAEKSAVLQKIDSKRTNNCNFCGAGVFLSL